MNALASIAAGLEGWQIESAFLKGMLEHGTSQPSLEPRMVSLGKNVSLVHKQLDKVVDSLPERLREHSRVTDLRRAIGALEASIPRVAKEAAEKPPAGLSAGV